MRQGGPAPFGSGLDSVVAAAPRSNRVHAAQGGSDLEGALVGYQHVEAAPRLTRRHPGQGRAPLLRNKTRPDIKTRLDARSHGSHPIAGTVAV